MLSFTISDTKTFMSLLLKGTAFDDFLFCQGEISAFAFLSIDGKRDMDYYPDTETETRCSWAEIKPLVFQAVKGKKIPKQMKLVLARPKADLLSYPNLRDVFWNLIFRDNTLLCTLSVLEETFSMDKAAEKQWEEWVLSFCKTHNITVQKG